MKTYKRKLADGTEIDSLISPEEDRDTMLTLKHGLPASLVRELQAKGKVKYDEGRVLFSTTVAHETDAFIKQLAEELGIKKGKALDKIVRLVKDAKDQLDEEPTKDRLGKMARRRKAH